MSFKVVGIGEVLWDLFPTDRKLGGAPANFAYHAGALGAEAYLISRVGNDVLGHEILARLGELGIRTECIATDLAHPTGTVTVQLAADGQPCFTIHESVAWDHLTADSPSVAAVAGADVVCFGSLGQRCETSHAAVRTLLQASSPSALRIFDVNLRQDFYSRELIEDSLEMANFLKLNDSELPVLARLLGLSGLTDKQQLAELAERYSLRLVVFTCGARGSMFYDGSLWSEHSAPTVDVKDTVGAGDSLTAAVAMGVLSGWTLDTIGERANAIAAYVCSCEGATPPMPAYLVEPFTHSVCASTALG